MQVAPGLTTTLRDEPSSPADPAPPAPPGAEPSSPRESAPHPQAIAIVKRTLALILAAVVLYGVAPAILEVLGAYRRLGDVEPAWWFVVLVMSAAGVACMCALQRLALNRAGWFP